MNCTKIPFTWVVEYTKSHKDVTMREKKGLKEKYSVRIEHQVDVNDKEERRCDLFIVCAPGSPILGVISRSHRTSRTSKALGPLEKRMRRVNK